MPFIVQHTPGGLIAEPAFRAGRAQFEQQQEREQQQLNARTIADAAMAFRQQQQMKLAEADLQRRVDADKASESRASQEFVRLLQVDADRKQQSEEQRAARKTEFDVVQARLSGQESRLTAEHEARMAAQKIASEQANARIESANAHKSFVVERAIRQNPERYSEFEQESMRGFAKSDSYSTDLMNSTLANHNKSNDPAVRRTAILTSLETDAERIAKDADSDYKEALQIQDDMEDLLLDDEQQAIRKAERTTTEAADKKYVNPDQVSFDNATAAVAQARSFRTLTRLEQDTIAPSNVADVYIEDRPDEEQKIKRIEAMKYAAYLARKEPPEPINLKNSAHVEELDRRYLAHARRKGWRTRLDNVDIPEQGVPKPEASTKPAESQAAKAVSGAENTYANTSIETTMSEADRAKLDMAVIEANAGRPLSKSQVRLIAKAMKDPKWLAANPPPNIAAKE